MSSAIDDVAAGTAGLGAMLRRRPGIELTEQADGSFTASKLKQNSRQGVNEPPLLFEDGDLVTPMSAGMRSLLAGSVVEVALAPSRFVFRTLELPRGADQFLEGIVRSQIDRLTPWSANEAAFGWSNPIQGNDDRITVAVAATARALVAPVARAILATGADSVRFSTRGDDAQSPLITLLDLRFVVERGNRRLRRNLLLTLAIAGLAFLFSCGAWLVVGTRYAGRLADLQQQSADRHAVLLNRKGSGAIDTVRALETRKRTTPSAVMTLEAMSKILPDDVYLTELRIEEGKVQISGVASDAATLIGLIEQSRRFTRATFYAPTMATPDGGETFHVEGRIEPSFGMSN